MKKVRKVTMSLGSQRLLVRRRRILALGALVALGAAGVLALILSGCGGGSSTAATPAPPAPAVRPLQIADVQQIVQAAVNSSNVDMVVAVVDRAGFVLGLFRTQNAPTTSVGNFS